MKFSLILSNEKYEKSFIIYTSEALPRYNLTMVFEMRENDEQEKERKGRKGRKKNFLTKAFLA